MSNTYTVTLNFQNLGLNHYKIYARVNTNNDCGQLFTMKFDTVTVATQTIIGVGVV
jgi:hypothetical protein